MRSLDRSTFEIPDSQLRPSANFRLLFISVLAAGIGLGAGVIAWLLYDLIALITNLAFYQRLSLEFVSPAGTALGPWMIAVPIVGALVIGLMARFGSERIRGHGIPEALEAILIGRSRMDPKVAVLKPLSSAISIGTGGPFGAEGPIIQTGGAVGSLVGQVLRTTAAERKVLLGAGAAAGMAATFSTPIAGVILAIELLLFEFKARSFIPLVIASTLATAVHFELLGRGPMFDVATIDFAVPRALPFYVGLGLVAGLAATGLTRSFYWVEDQFERLPFDPMWWPVVGALVLGVVGFLVPRALGVGYDVMTDVLSDQLAWKVLLVIMAAKFVALVVYLGSGTSGGLLAPTFVVSAALGALYAMGANAVFPGADLQPAAFALVAMAAVFGSASRATFAFIIFAFEITRQTEAILPLMLGSVIADGVALVFLRESIMTEKLARRGLRIHLEYEADVLQRVSVADVMDTRLAPVPPELPVGELADRIGRHEPAAVLHRGLPILDADGRLVGLITYGDVVRALESGRESDPVIDVGNDRPIVAQPHESVDAAAMRMVLNEVGRLPVVAGDGSGRLVGWLSRENVLEARRRKLDEEHHRESGWWSRRTGAATGEPGSR